MPMLPSLLVTVALLIAIDGAHWSTRREPASTRTAARGRTIPELPDTSPSRAPYSATSPHWTHIRTMVTDFRTLYQRPPQRTAEIQWAARHFDSVISGDAAYKQLNPSIRIFRYAVLWSVMVPDPKTKPALASAYYDDMVEWYRAHPKFSLEDAFLHQPGAPKSPASRIIPKVWDSGRYVVNPGDPGLRAYQVDRLTRFVGGTDGVFLDEFGLGGIHGSLKSGVLEYPSLKTYDADLTTLLAAIKQALGDRTLMINTGEYTNDATRDMILAAGAAHLERMNNPISSAMPERWQWIDTLLARNLLVELVTLDSWKDATSTQGPFATFTPGDYGSKPERLKMWELGSYYMVVPPSPDHLLLDLQNAWYAPFSSVWLKAQEHDVGHPRGARRVYLKGRDAAGNNYQVWARDFDRALVLVRPTAWWKNQRYDDSTAVSVPLPKGQAMRLLHGDGTLGPPITSVTLRNAEAAILIR